MDKILMIGNKVLKNPGTNPGFQQSLFSSPDLKPDSGQNPEAQKSLFSSPDLYNLIKEDFKHRYTEITGMEYYFTAKDGAAIKQLIRKLIFSMEAKNTEITVSSVADAFSHLIRMHNDTWINANFSLSIINSKYNEIITKIKSNGINKKLSGSQRFGEINEIVSIAFKSK